MTTWTDAMLFAGLVDEQCAACPHTQSAHGHALGQGCLGWNSSTAPGSHPQACRCEAFVAPVQTDPLRQRTPGALKPAVSKALKASDTLLRYMLLELQAVERELGEDPYLRRDFRSRYKRLRELVEDQLDENATLV